MRNQYVYTLLFIALFVIVFTSCEKVCDLMLRTHTITIVDQNDDSLPGIDLEVINTRTNKPLCSQISDKDRKQRCKEELGESAVSPPGSGKYVIVSSFNVPTSDREGDVKDGDVIEVRGSVDGTKFSEEYTVLTDECNLVDVIGPEEIVVELQNDGDE